MKKRYDDGGEIVVQGKRENQVDMDTLDRLMRSRGGGGSGVGGGSGAPSQRLTSSTMPVSRNNVRFGKIGTVAGPVYGAEYGGENFRVGAGLGRGLAGKQGAPMFGATGSVNFKKGGKAKKMAKGGSASKRADGCATKGKTKGRMV
jgi:hypothetical protein